MPEDVGGTPFPDGWEPDDDHDRGMSDEEFASVVFDAAFVAAATVHEPTAVERLLAAAEARAEASEAAEAEARRTHAPADPYDEGNGPEGSGFGHDLDDDLDGRHHDGHDGPLAGLRWHRPVAWLLAVVMGVGMVALAFAAVYRGASSGSRDQVPAPASTGLGRDGAAVPSLTAEQSRPAVSAIPPTP
ncbi:SCO2584 family spore wall biosynthesis protein [Streptomyces bauhiniae]